MKNFDICTIYEGLCDLQQRDFTFKAKTSYQLAKNKTLLEPYYKLIKKCEKDIWIQFGEVREDGGITIDSSKVGEANKALEEMMNIENDITLDKININEFDGLDIPMNLFEKLMKIISE